MKITVIGAGAMGCALIDGLLLGGFEPSDICATRRTVESLSSYARRGVRVTADNLEALPGADIVLLAVKPRVIPALAVQISPFLAQEQVVVSFAAGIPSSDLRELFPRTGNLFTVIPNTAIAVRESMTFVVPVCCTVKARGMVLDLFSSLGQVEVTDDDHIVAATALASCGIAYAMRYIRAASLGGVELGFKAEDAAGIVTQTVLGAARLLQASGNHPEDEIDRVCTPGGITVKGLNEMERAGFSSAVIQGLKAAK